MYLMGKRLGSLGAEGKLSGLKRQNVGLEGLEDEGLLS